MRCLFLVTLAACAAAPAALVTPTVDWQIRILPAADWQGTPDTGWLAQVELHVVGAPVDGTSIEESVVAITAADGNPFRGAAQLAGVVVLPQAAAQDWSAAARAAAIESRFVGTSPTFVCMPNAAAAITTGLADVPELSITLRDDTIDCAILFPQSRPARHGARTSPVRVTLAKNSSHVRGWFIPSNQDDEAGHVICVRQLVAADPDNLVSASKSIPAAPAPAARSLFAAQQRLVATSVGAMNRRGALLGLANRTLEDALFDTLLTADEQTLVAMSHAVGTMQTTAPEEDFAWSFASTIWQTVLRRQELGELRPGMRATMLRHFGSLSDDPGGLGHLLSSCEDLPTFWAEVRQENMNALADRQLAVRVRANDWLHRRGLGVADYDPFSDAAERGAALRNLQEQAAAAKAQEVRR